MSYFSEMKRGEKLQDYCTIAEINVLFTWKEPSSDLVLYRAVDFVCDSEMSDEV